LGDFVNSYSKLIGREREGKEYAAAGDDQAFLVVVFYELMIGVLIPFPL